MKPSRPATPQVGRPDPSPSAMAGAAGGLRLVNGDKAVNGPDLAAFGTGPDQNSAAFLDFNGDGAVNGLNLAAFRTLRQPPGERQGTRKSCETMVGEA
jgi:hypothetical protein